MAVASEEAKRYRSYLTAEWEAADLYRKLAAAEKDPGRAAVLVELAKMEEMHASRWRARLEAAGESLPDWHPSFRTRTLAWMAATLGTRRIIPILERGESAGSDMYAREPGAEDFSAQERMHGRIFAGLRGKRRLDPLSVNGESSHRAAGSGNLRAAVFGVDDGLVSNLSLVMGVAGAAQGQHVVLLAGLAGLLAGAFSMASGEYVSVLTQKERLERELELERVELEQDPHEEEQELALIYRAKGLEPADAARVAHQLIADKSVALDTLAREELGLNPAELGNPVGAAVSSFFAFSIGASVPVIPFLLAQGVPALVLSGVFSLIALVLIGVAAGLLTGRPIVLTSTRMVLFGAGAAAITYGVGRLVGVAVG